MSVVEYLNWLVIFTVIGLPRNWIPKKGCLCVSVYCVPWSVISNFLLSRSMEPGHARLRN